MRKRNRIKSKSSKRIKVWCCGCDRAKVSDGDACPQCGSKLYSNKDKVKNFNIKETYDETDQL